MHPSIQVLDPQRRLSRKGELCHLLNHNRHEHREPDTPVVLPTSHYAHVIKGMSLASLQSFFNNRCIMCN